MFEQVRRKSATEDLRPRNCLVAQPAHRLARMTLPTLTLKQQAFDGQRREPLHHGLPT